MKSPLPTREAASTQQMSVLLGITQALQVYLIMPPHDGAVPTGGAIDGGTVAAAANTFVATCAKIDELLADKSRWNLETSDALYDAAIQTQEYQQRFLRAQTEAAASILRPSFQIKPTLIAVQGGYAAVFGELTSKSAVIGYGATPEAAMADFDAAFLRQPENQHQLTTPETPTSAAPKTKTNKRKK